MYTDSDGHAAMVNENSGGSAKHKPAPKPTPKPKAKAKANTAQKTNSSKTATAKQVKKPATTKKQANKKPVAQNAVMNKKDSHKVVHEAKTTRKTNNKQYVTEKQLKQIGWKNANKQMVNELNKTLVKYHITTPNKIAYFISEVSEESGCGKHPMELGNKKYFKKYEPGTKTGKRLGNTDVGDGYKYRGAGYLQVTGKNNYQALAKAAGDPKIMNGAEYVAKNYAWESAGYWWKSNNMNKRIDKGTNILTVSRVVNLGNAKSKKIPNGMNIRQKYYNISLKIFKK